MRYDGAWSMLTYTSDDGTASLDVWNPRDGVIPAVITLPGGQPAALASTVYKGPGWAPPAGTAVITDTPPGGAGLGWPGQPYLDLGS